MRWPAKLRSAVSAGSLPAMSEMSVEVPPMSKGMRSRSPKRAAIRLAPATPPAGPESTVPAASRAASSTGATPPWESTMKSGPR